MKTISPNHPRETLAFYVDQDVDFEIREAVADFVQKVASSRTWTLGPPEYFDIHKVPEDQTSGDCCTDDVGASIEVYCAKPPWTVPREVDLQQFEESTELLTALEDFSRERGLNFEVYYAGEVIGYVTDGKMDGVCEMLLDEWERSLGVAPTNLFLTDIRSSSYNAFIM